MSKTTVKKIIIYFITAIIVAFACYVVVGKIVANTKDKPFYLFGKYSLEIVATDSMTPTVKVNSLVIIKKTDIKNVKAGDGTGDVICYRALNGSLAGKNILHRAVSLRKDQNGNVYIKTKGDKFGSPIDQEAMPSQPEVTKGNFLGVMVWDSLFLGSVIVFLRSSFIFIVLGVVLTVVILKVVKRRKTKSND